MKKRLFYVIGMLFILMICTGQAQVCGDVSGDGSLTLTDFQLVVNYLYVTHIPPPVPENMDVDGRLGFTILDLKYWYAQQPFDCSWDSCYDYRISYEDTVYIPSYPCPAGAIEVILPVRAHFSPDVEGFYFPIKFPAAGTGLSTGPWGMHLESIEEVDLPDLIGYENYPDDSLIIVRSVEFGAGLFEGDLTLMQLRFWRNSVILPPPDCIVDIYTAAFDGGWGDKFAVIKNNDLYRPVIVYEHARGGYPNGDANCSHDINLTDVTVLVNSLFVNGIPLNPCPW